MLKVATSLDVPIKLLWPKSLSLASERGYTMLGLGDIVIPGTFIALALRYDHHRHSKNQQESPEQSVKFPKPYFHASLVAYVLGLITTMAVMHVFHAAQPALLYLRHVHPNQIECVTDCVFQPCVHLVLCGHCESARRA
jgi:minor histocompatibility antigen H13